jgi:pyrimidine-nucleoside phosphorylase
MHAVDIIIKKRDGEELSAQEIDFFVRGFTEGEIPDYQASAWAMAVFLQGMSHRETFDLTQSMVASGDTLDLSSVAPLVTDKHSTGGVGDKTTLVVAPVVAALGVPVGKISGRGLSFTGGTLDKMQSIPGYRVDLTNEEFLAQLEREGIVLSGQTADLAPADGKLYALRDVTGTVGSVPLIASSVMSKKIAAGVNAILLDVKVGLGAFMKTVEEAHELAHLMIRIGERAGSRTGALISDMNQPLGDAVGNALEVREAIDTLHGGGPEDFREHCLGAAGALFFLAGKAADPDQGREMALGCLQDGCGFETFRRLIRAQGGDVDYIDHPERLPTADLIETVNSGSDGYVGAVHAKEVGLATLELGGGRERKGDPIDYAVGVVVHVKVGDSLQKGDPLFTVHANDEGGLRAAEQRVSQAIQISERPVDPLPHFYARLLT